MKTPSHVLACLFFTLSLSGCSIFSKPNSVERIYSESGPVAKASDGTYQNSYPGEKEYPVTCEENCYPDTPLLQCDEDNDSCHFLGENPEFEQTNGFDITWLGHASFLVKLPDSTTLLFDPVSGQFDWPINWAHALTGGITRQLPEWPDAATTDIDAVLYSHLHYDHFNKADISKLGNEPTYFVHQDTGNYLPDNGLTIKEMGWYSDYQLGATTISALPAHHFNSRFWVPFIYQDNEQALWGGWLVEHQGKKLLFAGDTGYSKHFKDIQKRYGDIDVCLMPIASYYHPDYAKWYRYVHTTPEDALVAAEDLGCKVMIPWGYGNASWQMGDHSSHSPLKRLLKMHQQANTVLPLVILNEGESVAL